MLPPKPGRKLAINKPKRPSNGGSATSAAPIHNCRAARPALSWISRPQSRCESLTSARAEIAADINDNAEAEEA